MREREMDGELLDRLIRRLASAILDELQTREAKEDERITALLRVQAAKERPAASTVDRPDTGPQVRGRRILRLPEVVAKTGLCRASIYKGGREGWFPRRVKLTERASGWFESEVEAYLLEVSAKKKNNKS